MIQFVWALRNARTIDFPLLLRMVRHRGLGLGAESGNYVVEIGCYLQVTSKRQIKRMVVNIERMTLIYRSSTFDPGIA